MGKLDEQLIQLINNEIEGKAEDLRSFVHWHLKWYSRL